MIRMTRVYDQLYRAGGEEFVLVLNRVKLDETTSILEKLRSAIESHEFTYEGKVIKITISTGAYHCSLLKLARAQDIIRVSDQALYKAKNSGRNRIQLVKKDGDKPKLQTV
jgi:two-component system cell cycle response regulator